MSSSTAAPELLVSAPDKPQQDEALLRALDTPYQHGFVTDIESVSLPPGLDEDTIRSISRIKG